MFMPFITKRVRMAARRKSTRARRAQYGIRANRNGSFIGAKCRNSRQDVGQIKVNGKREGERYKYR